MSQTLVQELPFIRKYKKDLINWSQYIEQTDCLILGISRKGPRLLELLGKEGFLSEKILGRVFSEYALPYIDNVKELLVVDDSVLHGTTLINTIQIASKELNVDKKNIKPTPLRYSINAQPQIKQLIDTSITKPILEEESPLFIDSLIGSFESLGKPYDIEHPILYINGDFNDTELLSIRLEAIANHIPGANLLYNKNTTGGQSYTLLLKGNNLRGLDDGPEFSKIRFYLNTTCTTLSIVPISPYLISNEDLSAFETTLTGSFKNVWQILNNYNHELKNESNYKASIIAANFLNSLSLISELYSTFDNYISLQNFYFNKYDIQLLFGPNLSVQIINLLSGFIASDSKSYFKTNTSNYSSLNNFILFKHNCDDYHNYMAQKTDVLRSLKSEAEIINHIFYSQHRLEVKSRTPENELTINQDRLKFGATLEYLIETVKDLYPDYKIQNIHSVLDQLIDLGAIVPKYMNLSKEGEVPVWGRLFRAGEGGLPTSQKMLLISHMFDTLSKKTGSETLPAILFEKFLVMTLTNMFNLNELNDRIIEKAGLSKKFYEYGARTFLPLTPDGKGEFLLDWAANHMLLTQNSDSTYSLNRAVAENYYSVELGLSPSAKDKIEDIATFCDVVKNKLSDGSLVTITTLASKKEFWQAISAELFLWLNHPANNIYNCIHLLKEIRYRTSPDDFLMRDANTKLAKNANFTAQVKVKNELYQNFEKIFVKIEDVILDVDDKITIPRVWRDIKTYLTLKKEESPNEFSEEMLIVLRVCHYTTSLCRTLLNKAGQPKPKNIQPKTISEYLIIILNQITNTRTREGLTISLLYQKNNIPNKIRKILLELDEQEGFKSLFAKLEMLLLDLADTAHGAYYVLGCEPMNNRVKKSLEPPIFIVMWDMISSANILDFQNVEESTILPINETINNLISHHKLQDINITTNDGNCFLTRSFNDVLAAFNVINNYASANNLQFRVGCDVNLEGELHVYPDLNLISGRAYVFASRTTNFYKEIHSDNTTWTGPVIQPPVGSYLIVGEFAKRYAIEKEEWNFQSYLYEEELNGRYKPRVNEKISIPYDIAILTPIKPEKTIS